MKIKRFTATNMRQAMQQVRQEFGEDAVILSNKAMGEGVELVAAMDFDEVALQKQLPAGNDPDINKPPQLAAKDQVLQTMQSEINALRSLLESQLAGLAWHEKQRTNPAQAVILKRLKSAGLTSEVCRNTVNCIVSNDLEMAWKQAIAILKKSLVIAPRNCFEDAGIVAFVGPTGVGKTTTIAKLAARYSIQHGPENVGLITTDSYRIAAHEQLATYGHILDIPVHQANDSQSLAQVLKTLRHKKIIFIDTAGISQRDKRLSQQLEFLTSASPSLRLALVLSAASQFSAASEAVSKFAHKAMDACVITKLDEASSLGEVISVLIKHKLPTVYVTDGQGVPEDIHSAQADDLIDKAIMMAHEEHRQVFAEETLAHAFGEVTYANE